MTWKRVARGIYTSADYTIMRWHAAGRANWELWVGDTTYLGSTRTLPDAKELCANLHRMRKVN